MGRLKWRWKAGKDADGLRGGRPQPLSRPQGSQALISLYFPSPEMSLPAGRQPALERRGRPRGLPASGSGLGSVARQVLVVATVPGEQDC